MGIDPARTFVARHYQLIEGCATTADGTKRNPGATSRSRVLGLVRALGEIADGDATDIAAVVASAKTGFGIWRDVHPLQRAAILRQVAEIVRKNARELAAIEAINDGNPFTAMLNDAAIAASQLDFFAGFMTEMRTHQPADSVRGRLLQSQNTWE